MGDENYGLFCSLIGCAYDFLPFEDKANLSVSCINQAYFILNNLSTEEKQNGWAHAFGHFLLCRKDVVDIINHTNLESNLIFNNP